MSPSPAIREAKGHRFLEEMLAWPLPLRRVNGLLVVMFRTSGLWVAEAHCLPRWRRDYGCLAKEQVTSARTLSQRFRCAASEWSGVTMEAAGLASWAPAGLPPLAGIGVVPSGAGPGLRWGPGPSWRPLSLHQVWAPGKGPGDLPAPGVQPGDFVPGGTFGHHRWVKGAAGI